MTSRNEGERIWDELTDAISRKESVDWKKLRDSGAIPDRQLDFLQFLEELGRVNSVTEDESSPFLPDQFQFIRPIGKGGHAKVVLARDILLDREIALKIYDKERDKERVNWKRFLAEARALAKVAHRSIARLYSVHETSDSYILCLEYIQGTNLQEWVENHGCLSEKKALEIGVACCEALAFLHSKQLIHGDVKPSNVMLEQAGRTVLLDFSIARFTGGQEFGSSPGTTIFMPPELFALESRPAPTVDIYGLGVLLYWAVSRNYPVEGNDSSGLIKKIRSGKRIPLAQRNTGVSERFAEIIERCLRNQPQRRYASAKILQKNLQQLLDDGAIEKKVEDRVSRQLNRRHFIFIAGGVLVMAGAVANHQGFFSARTDTFRFLAKFVLERQGKYEDVKPTTKLRVGDSLTLHIYCDQPCYVYLFNEDRRGNCFKLFPIEGEHPSNPVPSNDLRFPIQLPANDPWMVDSYGLQEDLLLVLSMQPEPAAEALVLALSKSKGIQQEGVPFDKLDPSMHENLRGIGGRKESGSNIVDAKEKRRPSETRRLISWVLAKNLPFSTDTAQGSVWLKLQLDHEE